jgi:hypothetical protein
MVLVDIAIVMMVMALCIIHRLWERPPRPATTAMPGEVSPPRHTPPL